MTTDNKTYLGDGVYCQFDGEMLKLTTEDGIKTSNVIWLDPAVLNNLLDYAKEVGLRVRAPHG